MDYRQAGVDVEAGRNFVGQIQALVDQTRRPEVLGGLGGFGGCFELPRGYLEPVLVSGTDGVGTKLKLAQALNRHDTVGIDLVAMCVNDVLSLGAEPLFFLDYLATGQLQPDQLAQVVAGIASGCTQAGCALLGGETAEMPGFYPLGEYDLAGFCVGIVEKQQRLDGSHVQIGDAVIGLASQGVHSNGYSLVRKIIAEAPRPDRVQPGYDWAEAPALLRGQTLGEALLTPTQIYVAPVLAALRSDLEIHGMAHITGGGLPENLPRCLGPGQAIQVEFGSWPSLPIFDWIQKAGGVSLRSMLNTFNMGIGMALLVPSSQAEAAIAHFEAVGMAAYPIGEVVAGQGKLLGLPED
ncbi:phosphoribosylformylglycinamidine cyclo-ligase [Romeria aff. gracilis LEGE 07310]|uniref:Phosphoribosylformylglycinamidine cyclo-ligase n=1 Tax=Vasconcelosia minhoensis LEGE 07310 TaxID=915328 RepID=A0A8J7AY23_9CYAN|nr:phosphoribosylformylglycinamidine cyclo-ligase [Romeria gracilis]MBE9079743.1 phosphoribosylformylglycinamidine cyclo-ligase [Romeria aff. gracilis LEGE 07310]